MCQESGRLECTYPSIKRLPQKSNQMMIAMASILYVTEQDSAWQLVRTRLQQKIKFLL